MSNKIKTDTEQAASSAVETVVMPSEMVTDVPKLKTHTELQQEFHDSGQESVWMWFTKKVNVLILEAERNKKA